MYCYEVGAPGRVGGKFSKVILKVSGVQVTQAGHVTYGEIKEDPII